MADSERDSESKKTEYIWIRAEPQLKAAVEKRAKEEGLSVSQYTRNILKKYIVEDIPSKGPMSENEMKKLAEMVTENIMQSNAFEDLKSNLIQETLKEIVKMIQK